MQVVRGLTLVRDRDLPHFPRHATSEFIAAVPAMQPMDFGGLGAGNNEHGGP